MGLIPWRRLRSRVVYRNRWIRVREDRVVRPDGRRGLYGVVETPPSVFVVAVTPARELYLVKQYRYPTQTWSWEVPQGSTDGAAPLPAAKRELREETGLVARRWRALGTFQIMNGLSNEWGHVYLARGLRQTGRHDQSEEGIVALDTVPWARFWRLVARGTVTDGCTIVAATRAALALGWLKPRV